MNRTRSGRVLMQQNSEDIPLTLDGVSELARKTILRDGYHAPILIVEGTDERLLIPVEEFPDTAEGRIYTLYSLGRQVKRERPIGSLKQVFLITEAWISIGADQSRLVVPPSQDPNRLEVLLIGRTDVAASTHEIRLLEVVRNAADKVSRVKNRTPSVNENMRVESPLMQAFIAAYTGD